VLPTTGDVAGWTTISPTQITLLAWPGRRTASDWPAFVARARTVVDGRADFVEAAWRPGPLATALGSGATFAVVRPDGHLHTAVAPTRVDELAASLRSVHLC
jgi:hypothetical protein